MKRQPTLIFLIIALGVISSAELFSLITTVAPHTASTADLWAFFISLFGTVTFSCTLVWQALKSAVFTVNKPSLFISLRQASLIALVLTLTLFFNSLNILSLWDIVPLSISAILIEFFFQADKSNLDHAAH